MEEGEGLGTRLGSGHQTSQPAAKLLACNRILCACVVRKLQVVVPSCKPPLCGPVGVERKPRNTEAT